jgi:PilZ domain
MPSFSVRRNRRSARVISKSSARLVMNVGGVLKMSPCLIVDSSQEGFRLRASFNLRSGQLVELIVNDPVDSVRCEVIWVGKPGSKQEVEAGLQTVRNKTVGAED